MADVDTLRVAAVVVSHDRRELLREALTAVLGQSRPPDAVVVVDNASGDGSAEMVAGEFGDAVDLLALSRNTGGAGGFAAGLARALVAHRADLVWLMDDDTVPRRDALAELVSAYRALPEPPALVASRVVWHDGREHPMNTPRRRPGASAAQVAAAADVGAVPVRSASFVSVLVEAEAVRRAGLPLAAYFLWNDDFEFTARLLRRRTGLHCARSVVEHRTRTFGSTDADPGERFRFEVRNKVWLFTRSRGLGPVEKVLYGGATLLRWVRTVSRSRQRGVVLRAGRRGLREGLTTRPAPTARVLAGLGQVSAEVAVVEAGKPR